MNAMRLLLFAVCVAMFTSMGCSSSTPQGPSLTEEEKKAQVKKAAEEVQRERKKV